MDIILSLKKDIVNVILDNNIKTYPYIESSLFNESNKAPKIPVILPNHFNIIFVQLQAQNIILLNLIY